MVRYTYHLVDLKWTYLTIIEKDGIETLLLRKVDSSYESRTNGNRRIGENTPQRE